MPVTEVKAPPLRQFIGQTRLVQLLVREVEASKITNMPLPHVCLAGRPGLGKDMLVHSLADARGVKIVKLCGSQLTEDMISRACDAACDDGHDATGLVIDRRAVRPSIVWVDECEQVPLKIWETIHAVLQPDQNGRRTFFGKVPGRSQKQHSWFPECSWFFTTNFLGQFRKRGEALLNRVPLKWVLEPYEIPELTAILTQYAKTIPVSLTRSAAKMIAERSMGTPRTAKAMLDRCTTNLLSTLGRPLQASDEITPGIVDNTLSMLGVDDLGLEDSARRYLKALAGDPSGKMSADSLAAATGIEKTTLTVDIEPFLIKLGLVRVAAGGRQITPEGLEHVGEGRVALSRRRLSF